ncbi:MAG TPA: hypothetical protein VFF33_02075 [Ignavibacteriaceae bacterium]|nr:hypothetical protein [Ignavibacteriaceae bacterium]
MKKTFLYVLALFIAISFTNILAQNNEKETVDKYAERLKVKVLLSNEQTAQVKNIINESLTKLNSEDKNNEAISDIEIKVAKILDDKQKAKFDIMKTQWLKNLNKEVAVK